MNDSSFLVLIVTILFILGLWGTSRQKHVGVNKLPHPQKINGEGVSSTLKTKEEVLYGKLLSMVLGDRGVAERLIKYEHKKFPHETRVQHIQRVIDSLKWQRY